MSLLHVMDHMLVRAGAVLDSTAAAAAGGGGGGGKEAAAGSGGRKGSSDGGGGGGLPEVQLSKSDAKELLNKCGAALKHLLQHAVYSADSYSKVRVGAWVRVEQLAPGVV
jgi:hypothetical protein